MLVAMAARETFVAPPGWIEAIKAEMKLRELRPVDLARALGTKEPQISKLLKGSGMRALASQVGEYLGIPPFIACSSKLAAKAMLRVRSLAASRPEALTAWLGALATIEDNESQPLSRRGPPSMQLDAELQRRRHATGSGPMAPIPPPEELLASPQKPRSGR